MNESFFRRTDTSAMQTEADMLSQKIALVQELVHDNLLQPTEEVPEYLYQQVNRVMTSLNIPNMDLARQLVIVGRHIDLSTDNNIATTLLSMRSDITVLIKSLLQDEFPSAKDEEADVTLGRLIDFMSNPDEDRYVVDVLMEAIAERKAIMRKQPNVTFTEKDNGVLHRVSE